jgi:membrane fusion protein, multidrug efflux system
MSKVKYLLAAVVILVAGIIVSRMVRQGKANSLQDAYTGITTVQGFVATPETFTRYISETGTLTGNHESMIAAQTGGQVIQMLAEVGDAVRKGEPLVRLDDELYQLESERAKIAYDKAKMDLDRLERLYAEKSLSESDIENARLGVKGAEVAYRMALKTYNDATIRAPFSGTVAARLTEVGQMAERGMPVVQLVDVSSLKLTVQISENEVKFLTLGAPATVIVEALGDTVLGKVTTIGSRAVPGSRTFPVELQMAGNDSLRSGMFARAIIALAPTPGAILLPRAAILPDMGRSVVYLARGNAAQKVILRLLGNSGDRVAVEGLSAGDTVITVGNQSLSQGSKINLVLAEGRQP